MICAKCGRSVKSGVLYKTLGMVCMECIEVIKRNELGDKK
jgi:DNA-directed RNA polymerase subunit RPC12/RpoP